MYARIIVRPKSQLGWSNLLHLQYYRRQWLPNIITGVVKLLLYRKFVQNATHNILSNGDITV